MKEDPYKTAEEQNRFQFTLSNCVMPFSIFRVIYKAGWEELNHVKVDLYSLNLDSSSDRRSILIFEKDDRVNYEYFANQFKYLWDKDFGNTSNLIKKYDKTWLQKWEELKKIL